MNNDEVKTTGIENPSNDEGFENIFVSIRKNKNDAVHRVELALNDAEKQDLPIINPMLDNEEIIDREWERYNSYTKPFRRKSDWIALQYFGMDNMQIYDHLKSDMYGKEYVKVGKITDGNCGSSDDPLNLSESADELYYVPVSRYSSAIAEYDGLSFSASLSKDNFHGVQFHPEKSGDVGERILRSFLEEI